MLGTEAFIPRKDQEGGEDARLSLLHLPSSFSMIRMFFSKKLAGHVMLIETRREDCRRKSATSRTKHQELGLSSCSRKIGRIDVAVYSFLIYTEAEVRLMV